VTKTPPHEKPYLDENVSNTKPGTGATERPDSGGHPNVPIRFRYLHPGAWLCLACGRKVSGRSVHVWGTPVERRYAEVVPHGG
jgi:hypothetical protein